MDAPQAEGGGAEPIASLQFFGMWDASEGTGELLFPL